MVILELTARYPFGFARLAKFDFSNCGTQFNIKLIQASILVMFNYLKLFLSQIKTN